MKTFPQVVCVAKTYICAGHDTPAEILRLMRGPADAPESNVLAGHENQRTELSWHLEKLIKQYKAEISPYPFQALRYEHDLARDTALAEAVAVVLTSPVPPSLDPRMLREVEEALMSLHNPQERETGWRVALDTLTEAGYDVSGPRAAFDAQYPVLSRPSVDAAVVKNVDLVRPGAEITIPPGA